MKFNDYTAEELALDPSFRRWVQQPKGASPGTFWEEWVRQHPEKSAEVEQARHLVQLLYKSSEALAPEEKLVLWKRIQQSISSQPRQLKVHDPKRRQYIRQSLAAGISLVLVTAASWWYFGKRQLIIDTPYGVTRKVLLPDQSTVTLNGNSRLTYDEDWSTDVPRQVWLEGEAYFSVTHQNQTGNARFLVHTRTMSIEVVGTEFNVSERGSRSRVVLASGKVQLQLPRQATKLTMQPGESIELTEGSTRKIVRKTVNPVQYTAWRHHELVFNETPLQEIAQLLTDTYGIQVEFKEPGLADYRISGTIPNDNVEIVLLALSRSSNLDIHRRNDTITINNSLSYP